MNNLTVENLYKQIGEILDPDINSSLSALNAIKDIKVMNNQIDISLELEQPLFGIASAMKGLISTTINSTAPDAIVNVKITEKFFRNKATGTLREVKNIIAVASGKGGVGKSSVAANLALALAKTGAKVGILDGDVYGPSQPTMFGVVGERLPAEDLPDGKTIAYPVEKYGVKIASMGFIMKRDEAAIVRGPMLAGYFSMLFEQISWGELDFLIFDLPPGTGDIQLTLTQKIPLTGAVIVTTPQEISIADVRRSIAMFRRVNVDIIGVIENMSYFSPAELPDNKYYIFGQGGGTLIAKEFETEMLGEVPLDIEFRQGTDSGRPILISAPDSVQSGIFMNLANKILSKVRSLNAVSDEELKITI
ncbi:MAG: Mrp/NBP35 family ATP-binding protein [Candidatus Kapabacteria bacterium]|nr:Mrp/NBP35 family ATP-binding protein [Candidatus Kapabacteria bacterium]